MFNITESPDFQKQWQKIVARFPSAVASEMMLESENAFKTQSWNNSKWTKNKQGYTPKLVKSGKMKKSVNTTTDSTSATIQSDVNYASYQQDGTSTIPSRKFLGESDKLTQFIEEWIEKQIAKYF